MQARMQRKRVFCCGKHPCKQLAQLGAVCVLSVGDRREKEKKKEVEREHVY